MARLSIKIRKCRNSRACLSVSETWPHTNKVDREKILIGKNQRPMINNNLKTIQLVLTFPPSFLNRPFPWSCRSRGASSGSRDCSLLHRRRQKDSSAGLQNRPQKVRDENSARRARGSGTQVGGGGQVDHGMWQY